MSVPGFKFVRLQGLLPRAQAELLPTNNAVQAENCDFAYGQLRSMRGALAIGALANQAKSLYTENGLRFYSWTEDVDAVPSPMANDPFGLLYYTTESDFRVTTRAGMTTGGGPPASSYRVGVPRPSKAPVLTAAPFDPVTGTNVTATFHYESAGTKYQEQAIGLTVVKANEQWSYTPPASNYVAPVFNVATGHYADPPPGQTPVNAIPVVRLRLVDSATQAVLLDLYSANSSLNTSSSYTLDSSKQAGNTSYHLTLSLHNDEAGKSSRAYAYAYVNIYGEQGPPSPAASLIIDSQADVDMQLALDAAVAGYAPIKEIRVFRTPDSGAVDEYFLVSSIPVLGTPAGAVAFRDNLDASSLNEQLAYRNSYPPDPALRGLLSLPNGSLMAWKGNQLHFSDAYRAWSWPPGYVKPLGNVQIIGAYPIGTGALVITTGSPFLVSGITPDGMTASHVTGANQAGVSKWAIAEVGEYLIYASHDGLVAVAGTQSSMTISARYFTRETWRERYAAGLDSMRFSVWDGRLIVFSGSNQFTPFMLDVDEAGGEMTELPDLQACCAIVSQLSDQCYFANGTTLYQFAGGDAATARWRSGDRILPPSNFGAASVRCTGTWIIKLYGDGALLHTETVTGAAHFRPHCPDRYERWAVACEGIGTLLELKIGRNFRELPLLQ